MASPFPITTLSKEQFPRLLLEIPDAPTSLNYRGVLPTPHMKLLAVVGSRKYTTYGKQVVEHLISGLSGYEIGIVSGLALGIDSLAHESALRHKMYTLAIPGSGLSAEVIYPASHRPLARRILDEGGGLLSEFDADFRATMWSFAKRNRIMAGIAHATLIIEATERSGTLITARLATEYNRDLLVVPGNIFSLNSSGPHQFMKLGATPVTHPHDILHALQIEPTSAHKASSPTHTALSNDEAAVIALLREPTHKDELIRNLNREARIANALLMEMEFKGLIVSEQDQYRSVI